MEAIAELVGQALFLIIKLSLPVLLISLVVGLVISIFQTVTSIQEQTLSFIPKMLAVFLSLLFFGKWIMQSLVEFLVAMIESFSVIA
jgi:flagellar biosynthetic protein FliQ